MSWKQKSLSKRNIFRWRLCEKDFEPRRHRALSPFIARTSMHMWHPLEAICCAPSNNFMSFCSFLSFLTCALQCFQQKRNKRVQSLLNRYLRPMSKLFPLSKDPGELGWGFKTADCAWLLTSPDRVVKPAILTCIRSLLKVANREFHTRFSSLLYHCSTMFNIFLSMARPLKPW